LDHVTESIRCLLPLLAEPAGLVSVTLNTKPGTKPDWDFFSHPNSASNTISVTTPSISMTTDRQ